MLLTSTNYLVFLALTALAYWLLPRVRWQNGLLVAANFIFYCTLHRWLCLLLFLMILFTYLLARALPQNQRRRRFLFWAGVSALVAVLGIFKYFNFFYEDIGALLGRLGIQLPALTLRILLPAGISFYTFLLLGYLVDVYRGTIAPSRSLVSFTLFASFFPLLTCGPIERARHLLQQIESPRAWRAANVASALGLLIRGFGKKVLIADNIAFFVDKIFLLDRPSVSLLVTGTLAFMLQIYADFSGYTDIARGSGRLLGFDLFENFNMPYRSVSPADFWRRWHISLSTWLRDYLFLPISYFFLRRVRADRFLGMKTESAAYMAGMIFTMSLAGLWHGASWNFVLWGLFHGLLLAGYHAAGKRGNWSPRGWRRARAWLLMQCFILFSWALFRAPNLPWLFQALRRPQWNYREAWLASGMILAVLLIYALLLWMIGMAQRRLEPHTTARSVFHATLFLVIMLFHQGQANDFIYFRF